MNTSIKTNTYYKNRWSSLFLLCAAQFLVIMDTSIIGVALPAIKEELNYSQNGLQWIFNSYVVAFGSLLLLGGKLSDIYGARRIFIIGFWILLIASMIAGISSTSTHLNISRFLQGVGSALIAPSAMTLLMSTFTDPKELGKAFGFWGASAAAGGSAGVFLGGIITEWLDWRWVFFVNIPIAAFVLFFSKRYLQSGRTAIGNVDWVGAVLSTGGLISLVYAIVSAESNGWTSLVTVGTFVLSVLLFMVFVRVQKNTKEPLLPLPIFKTTNLTAGNLITGLLAGAWIPLWFFVNLYLQQILGLNPFYSGIALLPMTITIMIIMVGLSGKLIQKFGFKQNLFVGLVVLTISLLLFSTATTSGKFMTDVLPASILGALGMSLAYIPATMASISGAKQEDAGLASGIVNTSYQVGSALGLALAVVLSGYKTNSALMQGVNETEALNAGFSYAFLFAALLSAIGGVLSIMKIKTAK